MKIDVALTPDTFHPVKGDGKSVIVVDVLRASTTIITALANGGEKIIPFATVEDVRESAKAYSRDRVLLCGRGRVFEFPTLISEILPASMMILSYRGKFFYSQAPMDHRC